MTAKDAHELLTMIAEHAQALRERGVRLVDLGGVAFTLAGPEPAAADSPAPKAPAPKAEDEPAVDALYDQWTHGRPEPGAPARVPKRVRTPLMGSDQ